MSKQSNTSGFSKRAQRWPGVFQGQAVPGLENALFAPYQTKLFFRNGEWGEFGRGPIDRAKHLYNYGDTDAAQAAFRLGDFSEIARGSSILLGGEHHNAQVCNSTFRHFTHLEQALNGDEKPFLSSSSRGPVDIGPNVTLSRDCIVLSGVKIGAGAVVGAHSLVTRDVPPYAIVAGSPAEVIRYRFSPEIIDALLELRWWDFDYAFMQRHAPALLEPEPERLLEYFQKHRPIYAVRDRYLDFAIARAGEGMNLNFIGAELAGQFIHYQDLPADFTAFTNQMTAKPSDNIFLMPDIFEFCGMVSDGPQGASA